MSCVALVPPEGVISTRYPLIVRPPLCTGASHATVSCPGPGVTVGLAGGSGMVGVENTAWPSNAADQGESPAALVARTRAR